MLLCNRTLRMAVLGDTFWFNFQNHSMKTTKINESLLSFAIR